MASMTNQYMICLNINIIVPCSPAKRQSNFSVSFFSRRYISLTFPHSKVLPLLREQTKHHVVAIPLPLELKQYKKKGQIKIVYRVLYLEIYRPNFVHIFPTRAHVRVVFTPLPFYPSVLIDTTTYL